MLTDNITALLDDLINPSGQLVHCYPCECESPNATSYCPNPSLTVYCGFRRHPEWDQPAPPDRPLCEQCDQLSVLDNDF